MQSSSVENLTSRAGGRARPGRALPHLAPRVAVLCKMQVLPEVVPICRSRGGPAQSAGSCGSCSVCEFDPKWFLFAKTGDFHVKGVQAKPACLGSSQVLWPRSTHSKGSAARHWRLPCGRSRSSTTQSSCSMRSRSRTRFISRFQG